MRDLHLFDHRTLDLPAEDNLSGIYGKVIALVAPNLETLTCFIVGINTLSAQQQLLTHPLPSLTRLTLGVTFPLPDFIDLPTTFDIHMPKLQHLLYSIPASNPFSFRNRWFEMLEVIANACPSMKTLDLAELPERLALGLFFVARGVDPVKAEPPLAPLSVRSARVLYRMEAFDLIRPPRGLHVRLEALVGRRKLGDELVRAGIAGCRKYPRSCQEWKDAWLTNPGQLF